MLKDIFSDEKINTGRQREIDALKAFSIIMMIITHVIDELFDYEAHLPSVIIDDYLAQSVGAQGFMICMGVGILYSRAADAKDYLKRGVALLMTGQLLNLIRYALPALVTYAFTGDATARTWGFLTFSGDILQFAGLFFISLALFKHFKIKAEHIFYISVILNILAMALKGYLNTGVYAFDQLLGLFVSNYSESYFPLFHWMIFPAFGMLFGKLLQHVKDKDRFYAIILVPSVIVFAVYYYVGINVEQPFFTVFSDWTTFTSMSITDGLVQMICQLAMFAAAYFITKGISERGMRGVNFISKNINRFYCVHSVIIYFLFFIFEFWADVEITALSCYLLALAIIVLTALITYFYDKYMAKKARAFFGKNYKIWYAVVILLSIIVCIWAGAGAKELPNLFNDYLE